MQYLAGSEHAPAAPHFDSRSRIFELDSCGGNGKVCLVYKNCTPGDLFIFLTFLMSAISLKLVYFII